MGVAGVCGYGLEKALAPTDRAMAVAYEAGYRACAGLLVLAGYRVTSEDVGALLDRLAGAVSGPAPGAA